MKRPIPSLSDLRGLSIPVVLMTLLPACAVKRDQYDIPSVPMRGHYLDTQTEATVANEGQVAAVSEDRKQENRSPIASEKSVLTGWWQLFGSAELNKLVDRALANNPDVQIAAQRVMQARARAVQGQSGQYPTLSLPAQFRKEAPEDGVATVRRGGKVKSETTYQIGLDLEWRLDLWGERSALAESAEMQVWRALFDYDNQVRTLIAELVSTYIEYLTLNDRMRIAQETEVVMNNMLQAMEARLKSGDANIIDVEQQRTAVFGVRADVPEIERRRKQVANDLALLVGGAPEGLTLSSESSLRDLRFPSIRSGVPAALLLSRPDVRAIEARLLAAEANIDLARARVLPPLDITAQGGYGSRYLDELFRPHTLFWNFIANLSATLFDAGRRSSEVEYSKAAREELVETYVKVIHAATLEVRTALQTIEQTQQRVALQQEATDAARRAWMYTQISYDTGGLVDYLTYLNTIRTYHRTLDDLEIFRNNAYQAHVTLLSALGGGVPQRASLPGKGHRPELQPGPLLMDPSRQESASELKLPTGGWDANQEEHQNRQVQVPPQEIWRVELAGIHTREGVEATWRDLRNRNPEFVKNHALLAFDPITVVDAESKTATWYRVAVEGFPAKKDAEEWCKQLNVGKARCQVNAASKDLIIAGRFPWPDPREEESMRREAESKRLPPAAVKPTLDPPAPLKPEAKPPQSVPHNLAPKRPSEKRVPPKPVSKPESKSAPSKPELERESKPAPKSETHSFLAGLVLIPSSAERSFEGQKQAGKPDPI